MKAILQSGRLLGLAAAVLAGGNLLASPPCTAISYQGRLQQSGSPANGLYDFQFSLWDAVSSGTLVGATQAVSGMTVSNGLFDVQLDFGPDPFCGSALWLEVGVRTNLGGAFTVLSPRQPLLPTPYAIMANTASNLSGPLPAAQLTGTLPPSALAGYAGGVTFTNPASSFIGTFTGNGGGLSNLAGAAIQPGTLNSNKFDAGTAAQLALAGAVSNRLTAAQISAAANNQVVTMGWTNNDSNVYGTYTPVQSIVIGTNVGGYPGGPPQGGDILFPDWCGVHWDTPWQSCGIWNNAVHGWSGIPGASQPLNELQCSVGYGMCLEAFQAGTGGVHGLGGGFQMGGSGHYGDSFWFQYDFSPGESGLRWSKLVSFISGSYLPTNNTCYASMRGVANSWTSDRGALRFYSGPWSAYYNAPVGDGIELGGTIGNGWEFRGPLIQEQRQTAGAPNCALDFNAGYCMVITAPGASMSFFTTNCHAATTNYESRIFVIRAGGDSVATTWPAWTWLGAAPTNISPGSLLRLQLECLGMGETNILASAATGADATYFVDPDATSYCTRAGVADPVAQAAFNSLVIGLKADGLWTNLYALWPLYGSNPTQTAQNLLSTGYTITWHGDLATASYHTVAGVTSTGTAGTWGDTGFSASAAGVQATNFHMMVWSESLKGIGTGGYTGGAGAALGSWTYGTTSGNAIFIMTNGISINGPFCLDGIPVVGMTTSNAKGFIFAETLTPLLCDSFNDATLPNTFGSYADNVGTANFGVFVYNKSDGTQGGFDPISLAGASLGKNLSVSQVAAYYARWQALQTSLGR